MYACRGCKAASLNTLHNTNADYDVVAEAESYLTVEVESDLATEKVPV